MTYVRVKLALEELPPGDTLDVHLDGDEPIRSLPVSARADGYEVLAFVKGSDGSARLVLRVPHPPLEH